MKVKRLVLLFVLGLTISAWSATIHVPADFSTIQAAIDAALDGDEILVAAGNYSENIDFKGKAVAVKSEQGALLTAIQSASPGFPVVKFVSGETHGAILEGFTIQGANAPFGGIEIRYSAPVIRKNIVKFNRGTDPYNAGGGIYCWQSHSLIVNNRIEKNVSALYGAGIHLHYSDDTVVNNIVVHNSGVQLSGIRSGLSKAVILNNVIAFNQNLPGYSATGAWFSDTILFENNIIYRNSPMGVGLTGSGSIFDYNDVWGNGVEYDTAPGALLPGPGSISADPMFVDETNFQLQAGSPCIDAGDPNPDYNDSDGTRNDIGIYGGLFPFPPELWTAPDTTPPPTCLGFALVFDGKDYVEVADDDALSAIGANFTLEYLIKVDQLPTALPQQIVGKWGPASSEDDEFGSNVHPGGMLEACISGLSGKSCFFTPGVIEQGLWIHIAEVLDSAAGEHKLYKNGGLISALSVSGDFKMDRNTSQLFRIGNYNFVYDFLKGSVDEVRLWKVARSQNEIADNMNRELSGSESGLIGYWNFNEGSGQIANDNTGNANHGQLGSTAGTDSADPSWIECDTTKLICGLVGDFDNNGERRLIDVIKIVLYLIKGTPQPEIACVTDVNQDGKTTIADAVMLVRHIFRNVPLPAESCCE